MSLPGTRGPALPSDAAILVANTVPSLPAVTVRHLRQLLERDAVLPRAEERRQMKLGLLWRLFERDGVLPSEADYDRGYAAAVTAGESWPSRQTLLRAFDSDWDKVLHALVRWAKARTSTPDRHRPYATSLPKGLFEDKRIVGLAVMTCWESLGVKPTEHEYLDWRKLSREAARLAGKPMPWLPDRKRLMAKFSDFEELLRFVVDNEDRLRRLRLELRAKQVSEALEQRAKQALGGGRSSMSDAGRDPHPPQGWSQE